MKRTASIGLTFLLLVVMAACAGTGMATAGDDITVKIGESMAGAAEAADHDVTESALESGRKEYMVTAPDGKSYTIELTERQIDDLMDGTTVLVPTREGGMKVSITKERSRPVSSGW
jgi:hypothetical protein